MKTTAKEGREIDASLKRQDTFLREHLEVERHGRCPECEQEPSVNGGRCFECRGRSMIDA